MRKTMLAVAIAAYCTGAFAGDIGTYVGDNGVFNKANNQFSVDKVEANNYTGMNAGKYAGMNAGKYAGVHNSPMTATGHGGAGGAGGAGGTGYGGAGGNAAGGNAWAGQLQGILGSGNSRNDLRGGDQSQNLHGLYGNDLSNRNDLANTSTNDLANTQGQGQFGINGQSSSNSLGQSNSATGSGNQTTFIDNSRYEAQKRNPVAPAWAAPLTAAEDTCMGSTSVGGQGITLGASFATTWRDKDCVRRKHARTLYNMNRPTLALAVLCGNEEVLAGVARTGSAADRTACGIDEVVADAPQKRTRRGAALSNDEVADTFPLWGYDQ